jgi:hypothetical protein
MDFKRLRAALILSGSDDRNDIIGSSLSFRINKQDHQHTLKHPKRNATFNRVTTRNFIIYETQIVAPSLDSTSNMR